MELSAIWCVSALSPANFRYASICASVFSAPDRIISVKQTPGTFRGRTPLAAGLQHHNEAEFLKELNWGVESTKTSSDASRGARARRGACATAAQSKGPLCMVSLWRRGADGDEWRSYRSRQQFDQTRREAARGGREACPPAAAYDDAAARIAPQHLAAKQQPVVRGCCAALIQSG